MLVSAEAWMKSNNVFAGGSTWTNITKLLGAYYNV